MAAKGPRHSPKVPEIRKGDTVLVLSGRDAGKRGVVDRVVRREPATTGARSNYRRTSPKGLVGVVVEGLNVVKRHTKPRPPTSNQSMTGRVPQSQLGGIIDVAQPLPVAKVMLVCPRCNEPTRIAHQTLENGSRIRVCRNCGEALEVNAT
jgi:large subunit ribosomal protein L24